MKKRNTVRKLEKQMNLRCSENFVTGLDFLADREKTDKAELVRRSVREHFDNVYGVVALLKKMGVPSEKSDIDGGMIKDVELE